MSGPFNTVVQEAGLPATCEFRWFDPRVDGLSALVGARCIARDTPLSFVHVGEEPTSWIIEGEGTAPPVLACNTAAEVEALMRGLSRQPLLNFAPLDILVPDVALDQFTSLLQGAGAHLVKTGATASIEQGPYFDTRSAFRAEARQTNGDTSFYAATDATKFDIGNESFFCMVIVGWSANGNGGFYISKIKQPGDPTTGQGYGVTINGDNGFGALYNGSVSNLNMDTVAGTENVVDGSPRCLCFGRTILGAGLGTVFTGSSPTVSQIGQPGTLTNAEVFGLRSDTFGTPVTAQSTSRTMRILFWRGAAADNMITHGPALASAIESMLGRANVATFGSLVPYPLFDTFVAGLAGAMTVSNPARALNTPFQPSLTRPTLCIYAVDVSTGGTTGFVELRCDAANPPVTVWGQSGNGCSAVIVVITRGVLWCFAPPGAFVELVTVDVAGVPTYTLLNATEIQI